MTHFADRQGRGARCGRAYCSDCSRVATGASLRLPVWRGGCSHRYCRQRRTYCFSCRHRAVLRRKRHGNGVPVAGKCPNQRHASACRLLSLRRRRISARRLRRRVPRRRRASLTANRREWRSAADWASGRHWLSFGALLACNGAYSSWREQFIWRQRGRRAFVALQFWTHTQVSSNRRTRPCGSD